MGWEGSMTQRRGAVMMVELETQYREMKELEVKKWDRWIIDGPFCCTLVLYYPILELPYAMQTSKIL